MVLGSGGCAREINVRACALAWQSTTFRFPRVHKGNVTASPRSQQLVLISLSGLCGELLRLFLMQYRVAMQLIKPLLGAVDGVCLSSFPFLVSATGPLSSTCTRPLHARHWILASTSSATRIRSQWFRVVKSVLMRRLIFRLFFTLAPFRCRRASSPVC